MSKLYMRGINNRKKDEAWVRFKTSRNGRKLFQDIDEIHAITKALNGWFDTLTVGVPVSKQDNMLLDKIERTIDAYENAIQRLIDVPKWDADRERYFIPALRWRASNAPKQPSDCRGNRV